MIVGSYTTNQARNYNNEYVKGCLKWLAIEIWWLEIVGVNNYKFTTRCEQEEFQHYVMTLN